jgi:hypothetical protein
MTAMKREPSTLPRSKREPINKRPGRVVCICTAKGQIIYHEDIPKGLKGAGKNEHH